LIKKIIAGNVGAIDQLPLWCVMKMIFLYLISWEMAILLACNSI